MTLSDNIRSKAKELYDKYYGESYNKDEMELPKKRKRKSRKAKK